VGSVVLPAIAEAHDELRVRIRGLPPALRKPAACVFGVYPGRDEPGAVMPTPDLDDPFGQIAGLVHRVGRKMPEGNRAERRRFLTFSKMFIKHYVPPLPANHDVSFDTWANQSSYPAWKLAALREMAQDPVMTRGKLLNKCFTKAECYPSFKYPRGIFSYTDESKALVAPVQWVLDKWLYKHLPWNVKSVDVSERGAVLAELFGDGPVSGTDFTSFEAHHAGEFAELRVFWKDWILRDHEVRDAYIKVVREKSLGVNRMKFKHFDATIPQTLMSGDSSTSSDNLLLNMMVIFYLAAQTLFPQKSLSYQIRALPHSFRARFEGDDGIFSKCEFSPELVQSLGLNLKINHFSHFSEASFCGIVADPVNFLNLCDPIKVLATIGWFERRQVMLGQNKKLSILKAKAMSLLHCYPAAPVVSALSKYIMRVLRHVDYRSGLEKLDPWKREQFLMWEYQKRVPEAQVTVKAREIVERNFGLSIEKQIEIEEYFNSCEELKPFWFDDIFPAAWTRFADESRFDEWAFFPRDVAHLQMRMKLHPQRDFRAVLPAPPSASV